MLAFGAAGAARAWRLTRQWQIALGCRSSIGGGLCALRINR
ncbi:hypothetical protein XCR_1014 [Xanthomonas campestris pv. raphani 756C]|nr:hypothetical protein XCR_1014 [Xanthomonas campestris pv. raphani 756C]